MAENTPVRAPGRGNFFEDFYLGQVLHHATPRTVSEGDAALYVLMPMRV